MSLPEGPSTFFLLGPRPPSGHKVTLTPPLARGWRPQPSGGAWVRNGVGAGADLRQPQGCARREEVEGCMGHRQRPPKLRGNGSLYSGEPDRCLQRATHAYSFLQALGRGRGGRDGVKRRRRWDFKASPMRSTRTASGRDKNDQTVMAPSVPPRLPQSSQAS